MKSKIIHIDENNSVISYENGESIIASKDNDEYKFEDILSKEAEIEDVSSKIKHTKYDLKGYNDAIKYDKMYNVVLAIAEAFVYMYYHSDVPTSFLIFMMGIGYGVGKAMWVYVVGTRKSLLRRSNELTEDITRLETLKPILEKELSKMKEMVNYKTKKPVVSNVDEIGYNFDNSFDYNEEISREEQNTLKLTR